MWTPYNLEHIIKVDVGRISLTVGSGSLVGITIIIIDKCLSVCVEGVHFIVNFIICFSLEILSINERRKFIKGKKDYRRHSLICTAISIFIFTPLSPYLWEKFQFDWTSIAHMEYVWYCHVRHNLARLQNRKAFI